MFYIMHMLFQNVLRRKERFVKTGRKIVKAEIMTLQSTNELVTEQASAH